MQRHAGCNDPGPNFGPEKRFFKPGLGATAGDALISYRKDRVISHGKLRTLTVQT
jgi:hypothetical protein